MSFIVISLFSYPLGNILRNKMFYHSLFIITLQWAQATQCLSSNYCLFSRHSSGTVVAESQHLWFLHLRRHLVTEMCQLSTVWFLRRFWSIVFFFFSNQGYCLQRDMKWHPEYSQQHKFSRERLWTRVWAVLFHFWMIRFRRFFLWIITELQEETRQEILVVLPVVLHVCYSCTSTGLSVTIKTLRCGILPRRKSASLQPSFFVSTALCHGLAEIFIQHKLLIAVSCSRVFLDVLPGLNPPTTFQ